MLTIGIDPKRKEPIYEQIYIYIRDEIRSGALDCGTKLPSSRKLADHLDVSRNTVDLAYSQLLSEGYIESKPKRGYFVTQIDEMLDDVAELPVDEEEETEESYAYDFASNGVDMLHFPYNTWRKLMKEVLMDDNSELFQKGKSSGDLELRKEIKQYLHQSRGVSCSSSQIILGSGMEYLLLLLSQILGEPYVVGMENPTYLQAYRVFTQLGLPVKAISMDEQGMKIEDLREQKVQIAYVMPSHQYPTGIVMPINRRNALLAWARNEEDHYIIEDDYDSEFRYHGKPIPSLQGNDKNGKVIYMGTFSKAIAPAIRISYMVLPKQLLIRYNELLSFYSCTVSRIDQAVLTGFLREGHFERHLNRMRALYRGKNQFILQQLKIFGNDIRIRGSSAGLHLLVKFTKINDHLKFQERLQQAGIKMYPISHYYIKGKPEQEQYIMGFARMKEEQIREGIQKIMEIHDQLV